MFILSSSFQAFGSIGLVPKVKEITLTRGGWCEYDAKVFNQSNEVLSFVMIAEALYDDQNVDSSNREEVVNRSCAEWISFNPKTFTLPPSGSCLVKISVKAPKDISGSYYSVVKCMLDHPKEINLDTGKNSGTMLNLNIGIGSLLFITARSSNNTVIINPDTVKIFPGNDADAFQLSLNSSKSDGSKWRIEVPVKNNGNIYTQVLGEVSIYSENAKLFDKKPLSSGGMFLLPGRVQYLTASGDKCIPDGHYFIKLNISSKDGKRGSATYPFSVLDGNIFHGPASKELMALIQSTKPSFKIKNGLNKVDIIAGCNRTIAISLNNESKDTLLLRPRIMDISCDRDGHISTVGNNIDSCLSSCASWIDVEADSVNLFPNRTSTVKIKLNAPDTLNGEYFALLTFDDYNGTTEILPFEFQLPRSALIIAADKRTIKRSASIESMTITNISEKHKIDITIKNLGNAVCYVSGKIEIMNKSGITIGEPIEFGSINEILFPGVSRTFSVLIDELFTRGDYQAGVSVSYDNDSERLRSSLKFEIK